MATARGRAAHARMSAGDRRAQLIDVALDVFSRQGFRGATTKEIAAEAGVTEAVIFRHFPSKQALYTAVLDSRLASEERRQQHAEVEALMDQDDDAGVFAAMLRNVCARYGRDPRFERVVLFAALEGHGDALAHLGEAGGAHLRAIRSYIARRQKAGALSAGEPATLLLAINGMAHFYGIVTRIFEMPLAGSDEAAVDVFTRIAMRGVSANKGSRAGRTFSRGPQRGSRVGVEDPPAAPGPFSPRCRWTPTGPVSQDPGQTAGLKTRPTPQTSTRKKANR